MPQPESEYKRILREMGPAPQVPWSGNIRGIPLNAEAAGEAKRQNELYYKEADRRLSEAYSPAYGSTLGQAARYTGQSMEEMATPSQYRNRQGEQEMSMPHVNEGRVPTLRNEPEMMRLDPGQFGGPQEPNIRIPHTFSDPNPDAPTNALQRGDILATLHRNQLRPYPQYGAGGNTFLMKEHELAAALAADGQHTPEEALNMARRQLAPGGDPGSDYNQARIRAANAVAGRNEGETSAIPGRTQRLDADSRNRNFNRSRNALTNEGNLAERQAHDTELETQGGERINSARENARFLQQYVMELNKTNTLSPQAQQELLDNPQLFNQGPDATPEDMTSMQRLKTFLGGKPPQKSTLKPVPKYTPSRGGGRAGVSFEGARPGTYVGEPIAKDGKIIGKWNGQQWVAQ